MNNIPVFTAAGGTATLILSEIPYRKSARILPRTWEPGGLQPLLREAAVFCRMAGAEEICAVSETPLPGLVCIREQVLLSVNPAGLPPADPAVKLEPVSLECGETWREIYNCCFREQPDAETCTRRNLERWISEEQCFLAVQGGRHAGIGQLRGNELRAIGVLPEFRGLGTDLALALLHRLPGPSATVLVSTDNLPAVKLYRRLGFQQTAAAAYVYAVPDSGQT